MNRDDPCLAAETPPGTGTGTDTGNAWHCIGPLAQLPEQRACWKRAGDQPLAAMRAGDTVHVLSATCPHQGASLAGGRVAGGKLYCPAHGLGFDLHSGHMGASGLAVPCFTAEVRDGEVWVCIPAPPTSR